MIDRRTHIAAPYLAYNGATITCESHIADYNRIQDDINRWIDAGRDVPEWLLDWSFRSFNIMADLAREKSVGKKDSRPVCSQQRDQQGITA